MAVLSVSQARQHAANAGFSGKSLDIIVAIAQAESSLRTDARNVNSDGSVDRGILQINSRWHPEVSNSCADSPGCAFQQGYRISQRGTNFKPWSTYNSGVYLRYMNTSGGATGSVAGKPWYQYQESRGWDPSIPHYAIDLPMPVDTPFFFLQSGTITKASYQAWGGEIYMDPGDPGGPQEYALHLDNIHVRPGQYVKAGQVVGTSGGQLSGGDHPASSQWSTGAHLHWGIFTEYRNGLPYGPDPDPLLDAAREGKLPIGQGTEGEYMFLSDGQGQEEENEPAPLAYRVNGILSEFPGFSGIALALDEASQFPGLIWYDPNSAIKDARPWHERYLKDPVGALDQDLAVFNPDNYIGPAIRSVAQTIIGNAIPFFFRGMIVSIGLLLIFGLIWHAYDKSGIPEAMGSMATKGASLAA